MYRVVYTNDIMAYFGHICVCIHYYRQTVDKVVEKIVKLGITFA